MVNDLSAGQIPTGLPGGFFIYEAWGDERILYAEANVVKLFGCDTFGAFMDYVGGSFRGMVHPDDLEKTQHQIRLQTSLGAMRHDYVRYRIVTKQGEVRYIEDFGHLLHGEDGKRYFYVFIVDVDQNEFYNRSRNSLAEAEILSANHDIDPMTGLFNMPFFYQRVQMTLSSPQGRRGDYSIIHFDIPNFKLYNERLGFRLGDELLCDLARVIQGAFREDVVARFSDDHFVVFAAGPRDSIIEKVESVCTAMLRLDDANKRVRVKAGIYCISDHRVEVGLACDHARLACNSIKRRHDVSYAIYDEMMREQMRRQQYVIDHIDKALENGFIQVFYQPVVRVKTDEICSYEALVRWIDPEIGVLSPSDFIGTLEQYHLIHLVDEYVVSQVCAQYRALADAGEPVVPVSINISRLDFELCDIVSLIEETRKRYDMPREMLDIEITESALNDNVGHIRAECDRLKQMGYHIWLDDFGSGYSSLNVLANYSFEVLKLDLNFLRSREKNPKSGTLMAYIIKGARGMKLLPLTEGVETPEQYRFLKDSGCEFAQGYYFGKPMPMDESRAYTRSKGLKWERQ
ncbi:MAG: GGDEF and EAL domain-containing protein [Clostridia bacterium]|nr:GGDEF and EAL domain-containing protein [Clostridia bacterium]